jgi:arylsulfatase A-like enzyme
MKYLPSHVPPSRTRERSSSDGSRVLGKGRISGALVCLIFLHCTGCERTDSRPRATRNVLLVTLDTCRYDAIGVYGDSAAAQTPNIDRLADESVLFERAYSPVPSTLPSHASILTGLTPLSHGIHDNGVYRLGADFTTLPEILKQEGYRTAAFVSAFVLDRRFGLDQGFDSYDDEMEDPLRAGEAPKLDERMDPQVVWWLTRFHEPFQRRADRVGPRALEWLRDNQSEPFFLWLHFFDPHEPYTPPPRWIEEYDSDYDGPRTGHRADFIAAVENRTATNRDFVHMLQRYRGEVSFVDEWLGKLLDLLEVEGLRENTIVVVVADHGEALGDHGEYFEHNRTVYEETVRVPMIIHFPGSEFAVERVATPVGTVDIFPTLLEQLDLPLPEGTDGRSLVPLLRGEEPEARDTYVQSLCEKQALPVRIERRGLLSGKWKFTRTTRRSDGARILELYDLSSDPGEATNLADAEVDLAATLGRKLDQLLTVTRDAADKQSELLDLDEETLEKLRSLGYVN